jgi:hypothetical protein
MTYFDDEFATVTYDKQTGAVVSVMDEYAEGEDFRRYMNSITDAITDTGADRIIADTSQIPPLDQADQGWSATEWAPRAEDAGLDHMAMVMPESVISEMSVENIVEMTDDTINRELFDDLDEAKDWIASQ